MIKKDECLSFKNMWKYLFYNATAIGVFMGLLEVCWAYLLPVVFPGRKYDLPISTFGRFILIAVVIDIFLMTAGASFLGTLISVIRKLFQRADSFRYWPAIIRFLLVAGMLSYLYVGFVYTYYFFDTSQSKMLFAVKGLLVIILLSTVATWFFVMVKQRFGKVTTRVLLSLILGLLICVIMPNYFRYRTQNSVDINLPALGDTEHPNILLVTLDTLRADYLGCYGNKVVQTPALDALASDGYLFEKAFAQSPFTTPSHCSIMTSTYASWHGAANGSAMKKDYPTLAEILQVNGYETAAFVSSTMVRSSTGLNRGFDYYEDSISTYSSLFRNDECPFILATCLVSWMQDNQIPGNTVTNRALAYLNNVGSPFFCWLHYYDPHAPYDAPEQYKRMYDGKMDSQLPKAIERSRYAGEVTYTDFQLGRIIKYFKGKDLYDEMLIIITADHGEAFGEKHDKIVEYGHGKYLYDTTQHIPLIVKLPKTKAGGRRNKDIVQLIDIAPTVLDLLGATHIETFQGHSFLNLLNGHERGIGGIAYAETTKLPSIGKNILENDESSKLVSMRTDKFKYISDIGRERQELYDIVIDPHETVDIYSKKSELAQKYYQKIQDILDTSVKNETFTVDPRVLQQLKTLGYIGEE